MKFNKRDLDSQTNWTDPNGRRTASNGGQGIIRATGQSIQPTLCDLGGGKNI